MMLGNKLFCALTVLLSTVYKVGSIQCYYCNSALHDACLDPNMYHDEEGASVIPVVTCEEANPRPFARDFFCRKLVQTIFHHDREDEIRVTRGCGWVRHEKDCYQASHPNRLETVCQCMENNCNAAESADPIVATVLFMSLATCLYFYC